MRWPLLIAAAPVLLAAGCNNFNFAYDLQSTPPFLNVHRWIEVPEGQEVVAAKVGDVLHLPLGPTTADGKFVPPGPRVTVNGETPLAPAFFISDKTSSFVFKAEKAGQFSVETRGLFDTESNSPRKWRIIVTE
jgi:hypothetical protein